MWPSGVLAAASPPGLATSNTRIASLDRLRGLVLILMALDHCRDFVLPSGANPEDLATTTLGFFSLRWVTHFCAPVFLFLAGAGASLAYDRSGDRPRLVRWLLSRGLWLMLLEVTWVNFMWFFEYDRIHLGVLWAIGGSMVLLAIAVRLGAGFRSLGTAAVLGTLALALWPVPKDALLASVFQPQWFENSPFGGLTVMSVYVVGPWFLVMAAGWAVGPWLRSTPRQAAALGAGLFLGFLASRGLGGFGDPGGWEVHERGLGITLVDFLNPAKYPPSLDFLLMTLGPALVLLPVLGRLRGFGGQLLETLGRVPLFFYLLHIPLYHLMGVAQSEFRYGTSKVPAEASVNLIWLFALWGAGLLLLWPLCRRWRVVKATRNEFWVRYL